MHVARTCALRLPRQIAAGLLFACCTALAIFSLPFTTLGAIDTVFIDPRGGIREPSIVSAKLRPAVAYHRSFEQGGRVFTELCYAVQTSISTTSWGSPQALQSAVNADTGRFPCLSIINGAPAMSYTTSGSELFFMQAADSIGSAWNPPVLVDSDCNLNHSLASVGGLPGIAFKFRNDEIRFRLAADAAGQSWRPAVTVAVSTLVQDPQLCIVQVAQPVSIGSILIKVPAICFESASSRELRFCSALDRAGQAWRSPVLMAGDPFFLQSPVVLVTPQRLFAAYYSQTGSSANFLQGLRGGQVWSPPQIIDSGAAGSAGREFSAGFDLQIARCGNRMVACYLEEQSDDTYALVSSSLAGSPAAGWSASQILASDMLGAAGGSLGRNNSIALLDLNGAPVVAYVRQGELLLSRGF